MRIGRFGHAGATVRDLRIAEDFYRGVLGFAVAARFPEDDEVMLAVGCGDHILLKGVGDGAAGPAPGLHHLAFELVEGHRQIEVAARMLEAHGVAYRRLDHDGDAALYCHDPDGHLLELYTAPGTTPRYATAAQRLAAAERFLHATARTVDRSVHARRFHGGSAAHVRQALNAYRNPDGGFGHALEPDVRCPSSQPLHTLTALELLREADIRAPDVADACCEFLSGLATVDFALPALQAEALDHPAAAHWQGPSATEASLTWTIGLAAELCWHGARHPWAARAVQAAGAHLTAVAGEAHQLLYAVRFAGLVLDGEARSSALDRLCRQLAQAEFYVPETPVLRYGLTPLHYAPHPQAPAARHLDAHRLTAHVDDLLDAQSGDGGWPVRFEPPSEAARLEWRGRWTVEALGVLRAYGRL